MSTKLDKQIQKLLKKSRAHRKKNHGEKALELLREACELARYEDELWMERAELAEELGQTAEAAEAFFHLADIFARGGMQSRAAQLIKRTLSLDPGHGGARSFARMLRAYMDDADAPEVLVSPPQHEDEEEEPDPYSKPAHAAQPEPPQPPPVPAPGSERGAGGGGLDWSAAREANRDHAPPDELSPVLELEAEPADDRRDDAGFELEFGMGPNPDAGLAGSDLDEGQFAILEPEPDEEDEDTANTLVRGDRVLADSFDLGAAGPSEARPETDRQPTVPVVELGRLAASEDSDVGPVPGALSPEWQRQAQSDRKAEHRISHQSAQLAVADLKDAPTAAEIEAIKTDPDLDLIEAVAETIPISPLLSELDSDLVKYLIENSSLRYCPAGDVVFAEGDEGSNLFLILRGEVTVERRESKAAPAQRVATLRPGAFFGEMSLLTDAPRTATVRAGTELKLLEIPNQTVQVISERQTRVRKLLMRFFRARMVGSLMVSSELFKPFSVEDRRKLVTRFRLRELPPGQVVLEQGSRGDGLYLVLAGELAVVIEDAAGGEFQLSGLAAGDVFGEMSLLSDGTTAATVRSETRAWVLRLPRDDFKELIASYPQVLDRLDQIAKQRRARNAELLEQRKSSA